VLAGDYQAALAAAAKVEPILWMTPLIFERADYHFFAALALAALAEMASGAERTGQLETLATHHQQLQQWAEHSPEYFASRAALVGAEIGRLDGRELDAERLYERAIHSARANSLLQDEAITYERASAFYRARGFDQIAQLYLRNARHCYVRWDAEGKVRQLDRRYPQLVESQQLTPTTTFAASAEQLDLLSVIKASQSISRAMVLPDVQETLMRLVLELSGAQRGCLLLVEGQALAIQAQAESAGEQIQVNLTPALPVSAATLPLSLITYVRRTEEAVVLADATAEDRYPSDEYIARQKPRSVLCLPIIRQSQLVGMLYLENNLVAGAFTSTTLTALEVLAAQAAIALDNARLYADLQRENAERQRAEEKYRGIFEHAIEGIFQSTPAGEYLVANPALAHMLGYDSPTELIATISDIRAQLYVNPEDRVAFEQRLEEQGSIQGFEAEVYRKDRSRIWISTNARAVRDRDGHIRYYEGTIEDITERKQAEDELKRHREQLEQLVGERTRELSTLLETSNTIALTLELQPLLRVVLEQLRAVVHYTGATIFLLEREDLIVLGHNGPLSAEQIAQLRLPAAQTVSYQLVRHRGGPVIVDDLRADSSEARAYRESAQVGLDAVFQYARSLLVVPLIVRERLIGIVRIESDQPDFYTERDAQLALAFANQAAAAIENARLYDQARELATVEERARLARELHDAVTQTLFSASMIAAALPAAWKQSPDKALRGVEELRRLTHGALAEMRTLLLELRPAALAEKPLGELLRSLCTAVTSRTRIPIALKVEGDALLAPEVQVALYRITQEALNNIAKHATASQVRITGRCEPERVELHIADDGRGFEPGAVAPGSLGLGIMRERAAGIGATLRVESTPGAGTAVRVEWQATPAQWRHMNG
ncbi:MAG TPA: GAF domain-containing protein, partial [Roseiflexaceae bacterium]|nr:GAF domain-containing protein [Roseiflexaceae bacterium]